MVVDGGNDRRGGGGGGGGGKRGIRVAIFARDSFPFPRSATCLRVVFVALYCFVGLGKSKDQSNNQSNNQSIKHRPINQFNELINQSINQWNNKRKPKRYMVSDAIQFL